MSPTERWKAVMARDRRFDGAFVYAVRSTGVYCRPSCASRRPRRTQVTFFPIPEAAEREGFRACRRCHPADVNGGDPAVALVREACRAIDASTPLPGDRRLARAFKRILGITPRAYAEARRVARFKQELKRRKQVSPALYEAGYSSTSRVYERTHEQLGMTPATYARGGAGVDIVFVTLSTPLGRLLVAATDRGVCRVMLGDSASKLEADLRGEFDAADVREDHSGKLEGYVEAILSTRTYAEVAKAIGQPQATRAVARACATNPTALVIPCHRVVRGDGALGGYRWGAERKKALLEKEQDVE